MPKLTLVALILATAPNLAAQSLETTPRPVVVVRSYGHGLSEEAFAVAAGLAGTILGEAGLGVSWLACWSGPPAPAQIPADCERPVQPNELILRLIQAGNADAASHHVSLGFSLVDLHAGGGLVATVYVDRVNALARGGGVDSTSLLARAIAHEIGHLLIGTTQHASNGLMRAVWSQAELRREAAADWRFSKAEAQVMRHALTARHVDATAELVIADSR